MTDTRTQTRGKVAFATGIKNVWGALILKIAATLFRVTGFAAAARFYRWADDRYNNLF